MEFGKFVFTQDTNSGVSSRTTDVEAVDVFSPKKLAEHERLVLDHRPTQGESVFVPSRGGDGGLEFRTGRERVIGMELAERPVKLIRPGLGEDLDQRAAVAALLRRERIGRDADLLYGVRFRA